MSRTEPISLRLRFIDTSKAEMILLFFRALFRYPVFKVQVVVPTEAGKTSYHVFTPLLNHQ